MKILLLIISIVVLAGCTSQQTLSDVNHEKFPQGCMLVKANLNLGYINQGGNAELFKLICSNELPEDYMLEYTDPDSGYKVGINLKP